MIIIILFFFVLILCVVLILYYLRYSFMRYEKKREKNIFLRCIDKEIEEGRRIPDMVYERLEKLQKEYDDIRLFGNLWNKRSGKDLEV